MVTLSNGYSIEWVTLLNGYSIEWLLYRIVTLWNGYFIEWSLYRMVTPSNGYSIEWLFYRIVSVKQSMTEKCFQKCVAKPDSSLDSGETVGSIIS